MSTGASPSEYISKGEINASYRPKGHGVSPGLERARAPFRVRNAVTGVAIASFVVGVWAYSISAVKQDNFDDVDDEARALAGQRRVSLEDEAKARKAASERLTLASTVSSVQAVPDVDSKTAAPPPADAPRRGILAPMSDRFPSLLDPRSKTLVWGAPPVDQLGKMGISTRH